MSIENDSPGCRCAADSPPPSPPPPHRDRSPIVAARPSGTAHIRTRDFDHNPPGCGVPAQRGDAAPSAGVAAPGVVAAAASAVATGVPAPRGDGASAGERKPKGNSSASSAAESQFERRTVRVGRAAASRISPSHAATSGS